MKFERKQFTFYRSFYEAMQKLPARKREKLAMFIIEYALTETEPDTNDSTLLAAFTIIRPILDSGRIKAQAGKMGGSASGETRRANQKQNEANAKQNEANAKQEKEKEKEQVQVQGEEQEQGQCFPPERLNLSLFSDVFEDLRRCEVCMEDKDKAECESLCAEFGSKALHDAIYRAKEANVPRWSYIRKIVTTGGVRPGGTGASRRVRETNAQCQGHNEPPPPDSVMGQAIREMLDEDFGEEEQT